jgi:Family of unknown function (DUF6084)
MSTQPTPAVAPPAVPNPEMTVLSAEPVERALAPLLRFRLRAEDASGRDVYTIALSAQVNLEPAKRRYDDDDRVAMADLFGDPNRWGSTTMPIVWTRIDVLTPSFTGSCEFELDVPCTYDLEVAVAKYFHALRDGEAPMAFHFNGRVLYRGEDGGLQVVLVPWTCSADFRLPVATWRAMMDRHHPEGGWVRLQDPTIAALRRRATERGLPSLDAALAELLEE